MREREHVVVLQWFRSGRQYKVKQKGIGKWVEIEGEDDGEERQGKNVTERERDTKRERVREEERRRELHQAWSSALS